MPTSNIKNNFALVEKQQISNIQKEKVEEVITYIVDSVMSLAGGQGGRHVLRGGGAYAPPVFGRSVHPIMTSGATLSPPGIWKFS